MSGIGMRWKMIQLQIINKILTDKSFDFILFHGITEDYFGNFKEEFCFIRDHFMKYGNVPDKNTFLDNFNHMEFVECLESDQYLMDTLQEDYLFSQASKVINNLVPIMEGDANKGVEFLVQNLPVLTKDIRIAGVDIVKMVDRRLEKYLETKRIERDKLISTGFEELDSVLYGWMPGADLVTFVGRISEGKSFIVLKTAVAAWLQGRRVGIYNSEMTQEEVGYRFDTLVGNFSNYKLLTGNHSIKEDYTKYAEDLKKKNSLIVTTKREIGGKLTMSKMRALIERYDLDMFIIDQYSGMVDENAKRGENRKDKYARLADELMDLSISKKIPIIGAVQANREAAKKGKDNNEEVPELDNISDADEIGALSTRVISLRNTSSGLRLKIVKNRHGRRGDSFLYFWDVDRGTFKYIEEADSKKERKHEKKNMSKTDTF